MFRQIPLERLSPYKAAGLLGVTPGYREDSLPQGPQQPHIAPKKEETIVSSQRARNTVVKVDGKHLQVSVSDACLRFPHHQMTQVIEGDAA